jgi:hypothetical protein
MGSFMRHLLLVIVCMLPGLAGPADHFNLARILVTGSQRYREDDLGARHRPDREYAGHLHRFAKWKPGGRPAA